MAPQPEGEGARYPSDRAPAMLTKREGLRQIDVRDGDGETGAKHGHIVLLAQPGHGEPVVERDGGAPGAAASSRAPVKVWPAVKIQPTEAGP